ncbi:palmitoyltransferase ZDHHC23 [Agrilus planipennis]|uniref:Palmitoyltransferase n=1 Tax=Agrilus planipennis TaxID=224129 RepID=A0A1W4WW87_AGRPL|nr:palmitoyltransferase ZDHHC23 [Agrilus planipennis]
MLENEALCCCEYYDVNNERNHILTCCCNCLEFDEAFDNLISGKKIQASHKTAIMTTFQDRIRMPWPGGARRLSIETIIPCFALPLLILIATLSLWNTVFSFFFMFLLLIIMKKKFKHMKILFLRWTIISFLIIYLIFELLVIPYLEILISENITVNVFVIIAVVAAYLMKVKTHNLKGKYERESGCTIQVDECSSCQTYIPGKDFHCICLNCCVGQHNRNFYLLFLVMTLSALVYSSNLTLTTICHPFNFYKTILLPDDCSEVYEDYELALSFVSAVYSLLITVYILYLLIYQVVLVIFGFTGEEWNSLPFLQKIVCGLGRKRSHNRKVMWS